MADQHILPENDRDLVLAQEFGRQLESNMPIPDLEDTLISDLLKYRREILQESSSATVDSTALWNRIDRETAKRPIPMFSGKRWSWAAAASILIIITAGLFYLFNPSRPLLIAESQSEIVTVLLDDGSSITLRPFSKIYSSEGGNTGRTYTLEGEGYFEVAPNPERTFSVSAGSGRVHVLGTKFVLSSWGEIVQLYLEEGSVQFETTNGSASTVLEPGQSATITEAGLQDPAPTEAVLFTDWLNNEITFSNRTARYVFSELEQHFGIEINAPEAVEQTLIGGTLRLDELEASLNDLGIVLGGNFSPTGSGRYTFTPDQNN